MSMNKIIVLTFIASALAFKNVQSDAGDLTVDQYVGKWYTVSTLYSYEDSTSPITCQKVEARKSDSGDGSFIEELKVDYDNGFSFNQTGRGSIINSKIHIKYSEAEGGTAFYDVKRFDGGREMILYDKIHEDASVLVSRDRDISKISLEAGAAFKNLAGELQLLVRHIDNICP